MKLMVACVPTIDLESIPQQAIVLCGGIGSRLGELTRSMPKPLLPVAGRPFLTYLLAELKRYGFSRVVLLAAFQSQEVLGFVQSAATDFGIEIKVMVEPELAGTGGALYHARASLDPTFLLLNGDSWFDFNWLDLLMHAARLPTIAATLALRRVDDASRYGTVELDENRLTGFAVRPSQSGPGLVNGGVYMMRRDSFISRLTPKGSLEQDLLPMLVEEGRVAGFVYDGFFLDIGVPEALAEAQTAIPVHRRRPAVFLDRDGVLNEDFGYVGSVERFRWCVDAIAGIKRFNDAGFYVFVVTNQAGVARGYYSETSIEELHRHMQEELRRQGAHIDDFRYCPFHVDGTVPHYARASTWRKPEPGMVLDLLKTWDVDQATSLLIGDRQSDLEAAEAAQISGYLVGPEGLTQELAERLIAATR
jgi:D-glycero-D-manno-heptose 1,7-bisphosphate phosphatase